ncbi:hypothetical protein ACMHYB_25835 [Sorangium sp. So ce1128]
MSTSTAERHGSTGAIDGALASASPMVRDRPARAPRWMWAECSPGEGATLRCALPAWDEGARRAE